MFYEDIRRLIKAAKLIWTAKKGNAYSQYCLAKSYLEGIKPFRQNGQKYMFWLEKASEQDMADAQYELAFIYYIGIETPAEYRNKAISLLKKPLRTAKMKLR